MQRARPVPQEDWERIPFKGFDSFLGGCGYRFEVRFGKRMIGMNYGMAR
jgi:hypothetical protein